MNPSTFEARAATMAAPSANAAANLHPSDRKRGLRHAVALALSALAVCACMLVGCASGGAGADSTADPAADGNATDQGSTLRVAMELAYPPFETKDDAGNPEGLAVDFIRDFGAAYGYDVQIENTAWDGLIPALQTDKADLVISSMTITDE